MRNIFFLLIVTTILTLGKTIKCYNCIVDSPENNRTSFSNSITLFVGVTIPDEYCNTSLELSKYPTCSTHRYCIKSVVEVTHGEIVIHLCQENSELPHLTPNEPKIFKHSQFKYTIYPCDTNLCNTASKIITNTSIMRYLLLILLFYI
ncbi:uncharacterized protein LOC127291649 [Leptopilina boulardi]|uniref:uncharacterized protein LOC127291649 n=1 Tax=Leptopilina boulardi TaxID=63433 RepID=UPI0021F60DAD|nr:uncharacterized protein LOC127291649 [Leptopilina boulardi]